MNIETGEIATEDDVKKLLGKKEIVLPWVRLQVGELIEVKGCPCKLVNVNIGKQRFTLSPIGTTKVKLQSEDPSFRTVTEKLTGSKIKAIAKKNGQLNDHC